MAAPDRLGAPDLSSCAECGAAPDRLLSCSRCRSVSYCDATCQRAHWPQHRADCRAIPETAGPRHPPEERQRSGVDEIWSKLLESHPDLQAMARMHPEFDTPSHAGSGLSVQELKKPPVLSRDTNPNTGGDLPALCGALEWWQDERLTMCFNAGPTVLQAKKPELLLQHKRELEKQLMMAAALGARTKEGAPLFWRRDLDTGAVVLVYGNAYDSWDAVVEEIVLGIAGPEGRSAKKKKTGRFVMLPVHVGLCEALRQLRVRQLRAGASWERAVELELMQNAEGGNLWDTDEISEMLDSLVATQRLSVEDVAEVREHSHPLPHTLAGLASAGGSSERDHATAGLKICAKVVRAAFAHVRSTANSGAAAAPRLSELGLERLVHYATLVADKLEWSSVPDWGQIGYYPDPPGNEVWKAIFEFADAMKEANSTVPGHDGSFAKYRYADFMGAFHQDTYHFQSPSVATAREAYAVLEQAAAEGDTQALRTVGDTCAGLDGWTQLAVKKKVNMDRAEECMRAAAQSGDALALYGLADVLRQRLRPDTDYVPLLIQAANAGSAEAQGTAGIYALGVPESQLSSSLPVDRRRALGWFVAAALQHDPNAYSNLNIALEQHLSGDALGIARHFWCEYAAAGGNFQAQLALESVLGKKGINPQDDPQAFLNLMEASINPRDQNAAHANYYRRANKYGFELCASCGTRAMAAFKCSRCRAAVYCGRACQKVHWPKHKGECAQLAAARK